MKHIITAALTFSIALIASAVGKPKDPEAAWKKVNPEGKESITKDEFTAKAKDKTKAEAAFAKKDKDADGKLTKDEFVAKGGKKK